MSMYRSPNRKISKKDPGHGVIWVSLRAAVGDHQHNQPKITPVAQPGTPNGKHISGAGCLCGKCFALKVLNMKEAPAKIVKSSIR
jgi:hypothetical protein